MNRSLRIFGPHLIAGLVLVFALAAALAAAHSAAAGIAVLTSFDGSNVGSPLGSLVQGRDGNFYGTTGAGGATGNGSMFRLTPTGIVTVLHTFSDGTVPNDGQDPNGALVQGNDGDFYGTAQNGGTAGQGTVFKITPTGTETILHSFFDGSVPNDGINPLAGLLRGQDGNFYGTTFSGGSDGFGMVFKITPAGIETVLHSFRDGSVPSDGYAPQAALIQGSDGNFYGTTFFGGTVGGGTVYKMTPAGGVSILHNFGDGSVVNDGSYPYAALVQGADGNFYGTTGGGGLSNEGTAFKITSAGIETVLHIFGDGSISNDGTSPAAALVQGSNGDFYGTTQFGGVAGDGTVFEITADGQETILHSFSPINAEYSNGDGGYSGIALVPGTDRNFYGMAGSGGTDGSGTAFRLTLTSTQPPTITSFTPGEGPVGSLVTLTGTGLDSVSAVRFHDASAAYFYSNVTGTQLTVIVPQGAMKGTLTVTNSLGLAKTATPFRITYAPVITSFSPTRGPVGTVVTITGTHLTGITRVRFHEADATVYASNAAGTQLTVTVPPGAKTGTITLDNRDTLKTTSTGVFTVTP